MKTDKELEQFLINITKGEVFSTLGMSSVLVNAAPIIFGGLKDIKKFQEDFEKGIIFQNSNLAATKLPIGGTDQFLPIFQDYQVITKDELKRIKLLIENPSDELKKNIELREEKEINQSLDSLLSGLNIERGGI